MKKLSLILIVTVALGACAGKEKIAPEQTLPEIYQDAYAKLEKQKYEEASMEFLKAESQFPSSPWAADALIMAAYSQYKDEDFAGAILTADRFMRFHPGHTEVPYVLYLRGMCYYRQVSDVRREPGMSAYALQQFQQLIERFPNSEYAENAKNKVNILKNYIAGKIMYSARRDMARENWPSAINRLQSIVTGAQETVMTSEAMFRLVEAYTAIGLTEQADGYRAMLSLNFPEGDWTKKADNITKKDIKEDTQDTKRKSLRWVIY
ncbi:MAG: outer membrane protein assembly factor BamD [Rickettsiales bacterium]|jgi:outer membrane protein assembly factor BamD|nr:outer membrane protein assembly factor BamD [Rickettsiales bacterium]